MVQYIVEARQQIVEARQQILEVLQVEFCEEVLSKGVHMDFARTPIGDAFSLHKMCVQHGDLGPHLNVCSPSRRWL